MDIVLDRYSYAPTETEGRLILPAFFLWTIERPWKDNRPFVSCIPDGEYDLIPHTRPDDPNRRSSDNEVYAIVNPDLGVNLYDQGDGSRYLILAHSANFVYQVVGCVAPGLSRGFMSYKSKDGKLVMERCVKSSRKAMQKLRVALGREKHKLIIKSVCGAKL